MEFTASLVHRHKAMTLTSSIDFHAETVASGHEIKQRHALEKNRKEKKNYLSTKPGPRSVP